MPDGEAAGTGYRGTDQGDQLRKGGKGGLEVVLSGYMRPDGTPRRMEERAAFWTAMPHRAGDTAWHRDVSADPRVYRSAVDIGYFLSVRCVRDAPFAGAHTRKLDR
jgi:hypothetical protein